MQRKGNMTIEVMLSEKDAQRHAESESLNVESTQRKHADLSSVVVLVLFL